MFVKKFNSHSSVYLSRGFFASLAASSNCESEKANFFQQLPKNLSLFCAALYNIKIVALYTSFDTKTFITWGLKKSQKPAAVLELGKNSIVLLGPWFRSSSSKPLSVNDLFSHV